MFFFKQSLYIVNILCSFSSLDSMVQCTGEDMQTNLSLSSLIQDAILCGWATTTLQKYRFLWRTLRFSSVYICSMIFYSGLWAGQYFNTVTPSSAKLYCVAHGQWHGAQSCWKISPSSKSVIKLSFSKWIYLVLFNLPSILTKFLEPSLFCILKATDSCPQTSIVFFYNVKHSAFLETLWQISVYCNAASS